jgi:hypothetical protein
MLKGMAKLTDRNYSVPVQRQQCSAAFASSRVVLSAAHPNSLLSYALYIEHQRVTGPLHVPRVLPGGVSGANFNDYQ